MADIYVSGTNTLGSNVFTDGDFTGDGSLWVRDAGWTYNETTDELEAVATTGNARQLIDVTDNVMHEVEFTITSFTAGSFSLLVGGTPLVNNTYLFATSGTVPQSYKTNVTSSTLAASLGINGQSALTANFSSISAREYLTSGSGTSGTPYIGLFNNDYSTLVAGDTLFIDGNVNNSTLILDGLNGTAANPITIKGQSGLVWINGTSTAQASDINGIELSNCTNIIIEDIHIKGDVNYWTDYVALTAQRGSIKGIYIGENNQNITIRNCSFTDIRQGIRIGQIGAEGLTIVSSYVNVENCVFTRCKSRGVGLNGDYSFVKNCTFYKCGYDGWDDASAMVLQGGNCTVAHNNFIECGHQSLDKDSQISIDGYSKTGSSHHGLPTYVYNNYFKDTYGAPVTAYYGTDLYFYNNIIDNYNTTSFAGSPTSGKYSAIRLGTGPGGEIGTLNDSYSIYNNIFMNDAEGNSATAAITFGFGHIGIDKLDIYNNMFMDVSQFFLIDDDVSLSNVNINDNLYYQTDGIYTDHWNMNNTVADAANLDTLAQWQGSSLLPDSNAISADPLLDIDYHPLPGSPCIGVGTTMLSKYDHYSNPNIGRLNHIGAVWPEPNSRGKRKEFE